MSTAPDRPREADARALYDEALAEGWTVATAIEAAEARGLAPVGWSDGDAVGRGWWCYHCKGTGERNRGYKGCVACERPDTLQSTGVTPQPATVRDLCAVLALGWNEGTREEACGTCAISSDLSWLRYETPPGFMDRIGEREGIAALAHGARQVARVTDGRHGALGLHLVRKAVVAHALRSIAESLGRDARPEWLKYTVDEEARLRNELWQRVQDKPRPSCCDGTGTRHIPRGHDAAEDFARRVAHELRPYGYTGQARRVVWRPVDVIRDALDTGPVWGEGQRTTLYADGRLRHTPDVNRPGEQQWTHLPAARALAAMGLRLGCVDDESVTLVVRSVTT